MKASLAILTVLLALSLVSSGCRGSKRNPVSQTPAAELEEGFKERWVTRRVGELLQSGAASDGIQARRLALLEFSERYEYLRGVERK